MPYYSVALRSIFSISCVHTHRIRSYMPSPAFGGHTPLVHAIAKAYHIIMSYIYITIISYINETITQHKAAVWLPNLAAIATPMTPLFKK